MTQPDRESLARALAKEMGVFVIKDDDPLTHVVVDATFNLLNIADRLLARWRLVPVEDATPPADIAEHVAKHGGHALRADDGEWFWVT